jgi:hypothetical protein
MELVCFSFFVAEPLTGCRRSFRQRSPARPPPTVFVMFARALGPSAQPRRALAVPRRRHAPYPARTCSVPAVPSWQCGKSEPERPFACSSGGLQVWSRGSVWSPITSTSPELPADAMLFLPPSVLAACSILVAWCSVRVSCQGDRTAFVHELFGAFGARKTML